MQPVIQVILFGYSTRTDVKDVRLAIVDPTPDATTLELRNRFFGAFGLAPRRVPLTPAEVRDTRASGSEPPPWEIAVPGGFPLPTLAVTGTWPAPPRGVVADPAAYGAARRALRAVCEALAAAGAERAELAGAGHRVQGAVGMNALLRAFLTRA